MARPTLGTGVLPLLAAAVITGAPAAASAGRLTVRIATPAGDALSQAVVVASPVRGTPPAVPAAAASMVQQGQSFNPAVMVVPAGARISFPNKDRMRHHIYSFSEAKRFEVRLYSGEDTPTLVFDKPGVVTLGCNIHDWMQGFIFVAPSPWFALTGPDGTAVIEGVPDGAYEVSLWHPSLGEQTVSRKAPLAVAGDVAIDEVLPAVALVAQQPADDDPLTARFRRRSAPGSEAP